MSRERPASPARCARQYKPPHEWWPAATNMRHSNSDQRRPGWRKPRWCFANGRLSEGSGSGVVVSLLIRCRCPGACDSSVATPLCTDGVSSTTEGMITSAIPFALAASRARRRPFDTVRAASAAEPAVTTIHLLLFPMVSSLCSSWMIGAGESENLGLTQQTRWLGSETGLIALCRHCDRRECPGDRSIQHGADP